MTAKKATKKTASKPRPKPPVRRRRTKKKDVEPTDTKGMLLLQVSLSILGVRKKGDLSEIKTGADKEVLGLSKHLLVCDEYTKIRRLDGEVVNWVRDNSLPSTFRAGIYHIKPEAVSTLDTFLEEKKVERKKLVKEFVKVYKKKVSEDRKRFGPQFRAEDYPDPDEMPGKFSMTWRYFTLGPPEAIRKVSPEVFEREKNRVGDLLEEARKEGIALLRAGFGELVNHLIERLKPGDGSGDKQKTKRFHSSNITNVVEFLDSFKMRDVGNDEELSKLLDKTRDLVKGVDVDKVRKDDDFKKELRTGFEKIKKAVDPLIKEAPSRKIDPTAFE